MKSFSIAYLNIFSTLKIVVAAIILSVLITSCGDDTEDSITANTSAFSIDELNTCDIGGTVLATRFDFTIGYNASEGTEVKKILFDLKWSNGDTESVDTDDFTDTGSQIEYDWCYRFGNDDWVEISHRLESKGGVISNTSVILVNKPAGAN